MKRMTDEELLQNTKAIIDELLKNASHSFGIDFKRLNLTGIEVNTRLYEIYNKCRR